MDKTMMGKNLREEILLPDPDSEAGVAKKLQPPY